MTQFQIQKMELIVLSLIVGAFFILFFYISKIFKQQPAEAQNPITGTDSVSLVLWIGIVLMPIRIRMRLSILMPILIRILPQVLQLLENHNFFYFYSQQQQCQFSLLYLSRWCHNFKFWTVY